MTVRICLLAQAHNRLMVWLAVSFARTVLLLLYNFTAIYCTKHLQSSMFFSKN